jgi:transcriptional regulator with XRE-family HTH domain
MTGRELKRAREKLKLTQGELAAALKIEANSLARLERGERRISGPVEVAVGLLLQKQRRRK